MYVTGSYVQQKDAESPVGQPAVDSAKCPVLTELTEDFPKVLAVLIGLVANLAVSRSKLLRLAACDRA